VLINCGGREVSVHSGNFSANAIQNHLLEEVRQNDTTEIYLQINSTGATRGELIQMIQGGSSQTPPLIDLDPRLEGIVIKFFGSDGRVWWSGKFR